MHIVFEHFKKWKILRIWNCSCDEDLNVQVKKWNHSSGEIEVVMNIGVHVSFPSMVEGFIPSQLRHILNAHTLWALQKMKDS